MREETVAFLNAYADRTEEFGHVRRRRFAMANVLEDLLAQGKLSAPTTTEMLNAKLKNLLRAYKATRDNNSRTGAGASSAPYHEIMEQIFGNRPEFSNTHRLSMMGPSPSVALEMSPCPDEPSTLEAPSAAAPLATAPSAETPSAETPLATAPSAETPVASTSTAPCELSMPGTSTRNCYTREQYRRDRIQQKERSLLDKVAHRAEKRRLRKRSLDERAERFEAKMQKLKEYFEV